MAYADPLDERLRASRRKHYEANKKQYLDRNYESRKKLRQFILELKNQTPCTDCEVVYKDEPWLTEFDHVGEGKTMAVAALISYGSMRRLLTEIALCELVCLICHRRRTARRSDYGAEWLQQVNGV